jgi:hypothetical protein
MAMTLKRNTTPTIPIKISGISSLNEVVLVFKNETSPSTPILFKKTVRNFTSSQGNWVATVTLTTAETMKFRAPEVFVDVYPISGSTVYNTGEALRYEVIDSLLQEAII